MCTRTITFLYVCMLLYATCINETEILLDIYHDTCGKYWFTKWNLSNIDDYPCNASLFGIKCFSNHIIEINLSSNNLTGSLSKSIANLTALSVLSMNNNALHKSIPFEIFTLKHAQLIDLSHNQLSGSLLIPNNTHSIEYNLHLLTRMHLNHNKLSGSIPHNIDILFPNLIQLSLQHNLFSFNIPSILFTHLPHLRVLSLHNNLFSDCIPLAFNQSNIEYAYFHDNNINGIIPHLPLTLKGITLHNNDLTFNADDNYFLRDFLMDLNYKPSLEAITFYNNKNLYGELAPFNTSSLKIFMSHSCQIGQSLPSSQYFVPSHISLINNRLSSRIPSDFITPYLSDSDPLKIALFGQGNKFKFDIGFKGFGVNNPLWIQNSILNTNSGQLFYTEQLRMLEIFIICIVFGVVLFLILYNLHRLRKEKLKRQNPKAYMELKKNDPLYSIVHSQPYSFFSQLKDISRYLYFPITLLFAILTSILYFTSANKYYANADFLLNWSITYIGSATPQYNTAETVSLWDTISQWIAAIYVVGYLAFTLYLYYIFYYRFTFPMLFYRKIRNATNSRMDSLDETNITNNRKRGTNQVRFSENKDHRDSNSSHNDYIYTLSGKRKKKAKSLAITNPYKLGVGSFVTRARSADEYYQFDDGQTTKLFDNNSEIFIPTDPNSKLHKKLKRYDSFDADDDLSISLNIACSTSPDHESISLSDNSSSDDDHIMAIDGMDAKTEALLNGQRSGRTSYASYAQQAKKDTNDASNWSDIEIEKINNEKRSKNRRSTAQQNRNNATIFNEMYQITQNYHVDKIWCFRNKRKLKRAFKTIFWSMMFLICEFIVIFYFGTVSLANDNALNMNFNDAIYSVLRYSVWIVIAVCNSFIIPRISKQIIKKIFWICYEWNRQQKLRAITITSDILRSLNLVWIPLILLFFMHNDCGRYSNYYWNKCNDDIYDKQFTFYIGNELISIKSSICSYGFFNNNYDIDYGKCMRSILEEWGIIIIFSSFGYIMCMIMFCLYSISRYYYKLRRQYASGARKLGSIINVEYAEIWNHVQIVVIFGCLLPFVIPMIAFLLLVNKWVYSSLLTFNFRLSEVNPYFPAQLLIITNVLQQVIIILFMWSNHIKGTLFVTIGDIILDVTFAIWWFWYRNKVIMDKKREIISKHPLTSHQ